MNTFFLFVTILAWVCVVLSMLLIGVRIYSEATYTPLQKQLDIIQKGGYHIFPLKVPSAILLLSIVWLIAHYNGVQ